jgi:hypothetical protein
VTFPKKLRLIAWAPILEGEGNGLVLELEALKETKSRAAAAWRGKLRLELDRQFVRTLSLAIEQMHKRDRERLNRELERLAYEVAPLQITQPKETR